MRELIFIYRNQLLFFVIKLCSTIFLKKKLVKLCMSCLSFLFIYKVQRLDVIWGQDTHEDGLYQVI